MSKKPTHARGRRVVVEAPPPEPERRWRFARSERAPGDGYRGPFAGLGWRPVVLFVLALFALGDSVYLTLVHYDSSVELVCRSTGGIDCLKVLTSPQSVIFGIPVAVYGLAFYLAVTIGSLPFVWRRQTEMLLRLRLAASVVGLGFVAYLLYTELYVVHAICLWCTGVHIVTFVIFVILATGYEPLRWLHDDGADDDASDLSADDPEVAAS
jgi:uncharacterized membrane protein